MDKIYIPNFLTDITEEEIYCYLNEIMDKIFIPNFLMDITEGEILRRVEVFAYQSSRFAYTTGIGKDGGTKVMKRLLEVQPLKGITPINNLFDLLKDAVFEVHAAMTDVKLASSSSALLQCIKCFDTTAEHEHEHERFDKKPQKVAMFPWQLLIALRRTHRELLCVVNEHRGAIMALKRSLKVYVKEYDKLTLNHNEVSILKEKLAMGLHRQGGDIFPQSDRKFEKLQKRLKQQTEKANDAYVKFVSAMQSEKHIREAKLKYFEQKIRTQVEQRVLQTMTGAVEKLRSICNLVDLSPEFRKRLESVDCRDITSKIYNLLATKYIYPTIENFSYGMYVSDTWMEPPDTSMKMKNDLTNGRSTSQIGLLEEGIYDERLEEIKIWTTKKMQRFWKSDLKLKLGQRIKQKFCSWDGKLAFGWIKKFPLGPKTYGFYSINDTQLVL